MRTTHLQTENDGYLKPLRRVKTMRGDVESVISAFKRGNPVLVFDSAFREQETDLLFPAVTVDPANMRQLRRDCGGLLFLAIGNEIGEKFGLPWLQDLHRHERLVEEHPVLSHLITNDLQYDSRSAFTLSLNHRETFTGITDRDRALTTRRFAELWVELQETNASIEDCMQALGEEFRTPGHIPVCRESPGGIINRQGHTELAVAVARMAGLPPVVIGAEMLQPDGDAALPVEEAIAYGKMHGIPFASGQDILEAMGKVEDKQ